MSEKPSKSTRRLFLKRGVAGLTLGVLEKSGILRLFPAKAEAESKEKYPYPPSEILHFNERYNSGWFYLACTVPDKRGIVFWTAPVRSFCREPTDPTAHLLYGITNVNTGEYYSGFLKRGSFSEAPNKVSLSYSQGSQELFKFQQTRSELNEFQLTVNLPWKKGKAYQTTKTLAFNRPIIYESGDGVVPLGSEVESLYVSLALEQGVWADFQKFNLIGLGAEKRVKLMARGFFKPETVKSNLVEAARTEEANHRWGCFMLTETVGSLPAGTVGVYWEILDENNRRQPEPPDFTVIDLLIPGQNQKTIIGPKAFQIEEIKHWHSGHKSYLRKWRLKQPALGIDLMFETVIADQENYVAERYFYEGIARVYDPNSPKRQVGTGMLEQTHDEMEYKIYLPHIRKGP